MNVSKHHQPKMTNVENRPATTTARKNLPLCTFAGVSQEKIRSQLDIDQAQNFGFINKIKNLSFWPPRREKSAEPSCGVMKFATVPAKQQQSISSDEIFGVEKTYVSGPLMSNQQPGRIVDKKPSQNYDDVNNEHRQPPSHYYPIINKNRSPFAANCSSSSSALSVPSTATAVMTTVDPPSVLHESACGEEAQSKKQGESSTSVIKHKFTTAPLPNATTAAAAAFINNPRSSSTRLSSLESGHVTVTPLLSSDNHNGSVVSHCASIPQLSNRAAATNSELFAKKRQFFQLTQQQPEPSSTVAVDRSNQALDYSTTLSTSACWPTNLKTGAVSSISSSFESTLSSSRLPKIDEDLHDFRRLSKYRISLDESGVQLRPKEQHSLTDNHEDLHPCRFSRQNKRSSLRESQSLDTAIRFSDTCVTRLAKRFEEGTMDNVGPLKLYHTQVYKRELNKICEQNQGSVLNKAHLFDGTKVDEKPDDDETTVDNFSRGRLEKQSSVPEQDDLVQPSSRLQVKSVSFQTLRSPGMRQESFMRAILNPDMKRQGEDIIIYFLVFFTRMLMI